MYEKPKLSILIFTDEDIIRMSYASGESSWKDENVDDDGWT